MSHHPGPWLVDYDKRGRTLMVVAEKGGMAGIVVGEWGSKITPADLADARLIAAAPELFKAAIRAQSFLAGIAMPKGGAGVFLCLSSAIAKAEGRQ